MLIISKIHDELFVFSEQWRCVFRAFQEFRYFSLKLIFRGFHHKFVELQLNFSIH